MLDSHADLVRRYKLKDDGMRERFAKVEFVPDVWTDVTTWKFYLDEPTTPVWWTPEIQNAVVGKLRAKVDGMLLLGGKHELIVDGAWIVGGSAVVSDVRAGRIVWCGGSAQISGVWDSARISDVGGSAQISEVWGSARISGVRGSARISGVGGSAQISGVWGSAQLDDTALKHCVDVGKK